MNDISVILPVYNRPQLLIRALESISRQTLQPNEVIVVDDGSDESLELVLQIYKKLPITFFRFSKNKGAGAARNAGIRLAQSQLIAFLDSDDEWLPNKLEKQVAYHNTIPGLISTTGFEIIDELRKTRKKRIPKEIQTSKELQKGCFLFPGSTMLVNRTIFSRSGIFNESLKRLEDWEWLFRSSEYTTIHSLSESLSKVYINKRPSYDVIVSEVNKLVYNNNNNKIIHVSGQIEKGISAIYARKYFRAVQHLTLAIKLSPSIIFTILIRCLNCLMGRE